jgi:hypothetical protein
MIQDPWAEADKLYGLEYYASHGVKQETETPVASVTTSTPFEAYQRVLAEAGCFPRDAVTRRIIQETRDGTGEWGRRGPSDLMEGLIPSGPQRDRDDDGIPDEWELSHGLDPSRDDSARLMPSGYSAIEDYVNELAESLSGGDGRG